MRKRKVDDEEAEAIEAEIEAEKQEQKGERQDARAALERAQPKGLSRVWQGVKNFFTGSM